MISLERSLCLACAVALLLAAACGDDATDNSAADTSTPADTIADAGADTTAPDTVPPDTALPDTTVVDVPQDTAPSGKACSSLLGCAAICPIVAKGAANPCLADCAAQGTPTAKAAFKGYTDCVTDLCSDVTETQARNACGWSSCFEKLSACGELGAGDIDCIATASCAGACPSKDVGCQLGCVQKASKEAAESYKPIAACIAGKCGTQAAGAAMDACIKTSCAEASTVCKGGAGGTDCLGTVSCLAKCPIPLPSEPNACPAVCDLLIAAPAAGATADYTTCADKCADKPNPMDCIKKTCAVEQNACFGSGGTSNCNDLYKCVVKDCDGLGGDAACVRKCLEAGLPHAKDAFVRYEGCVLNQLKTQAAKAAGCSFPYDEVTCLNQIKGFCGAQSSACFTAQ